MRPHFRLNISGFCTLWRKHLFSFTLVARYIPRAPSWRSSVGARAEREGLLRSLVSSARLLDGTIVTLTLVEG